MKNPTRHKAREAEYFLSMMKESFEDDNIFAYNLSAFLSAARSITYYMKKQYDRRSGFPEWYCQHEVRMRADAELVYLKDARVEDVHREPVPTGAGRELRLAVDIIIGDQGTPEAEQAKEAEPKPSAQSGPKTVRRFFPKFRDVDVMEFCENQLTKLIKIVEECENRFP